MCFRPGSAWELPAFRCGRHASAVDLPLPAELAFRRVRLMAQVDFAAVTFRQSIAEDEAAKQLTDAVMAASGQLTNLRTSSAIVRYRPTAPPGDASTAAGEG